jgi:hypothetical protein
MNEASSSSYATAIVPQHVPFILAQDCNDDWGTLPERKQVYLLLSSTLLKKLTTKLHSVTPEQQRNIQHLITHLKELFDDSILLLTEISSPEYYKSKSREQVLEGSTAKNMMVIYSRPHRLSIYDPATIHDIPFEVLENILKFVAYDEYLGQDLRPVVEMALVCRAWWPVAHETLMNAPNFERHYQGDQAGVLGFICGIQIKSIVSGIESFSIKKLNLDWGGFTPEMGLLMAALVAPTLSELSLKFPDEGSSGEEPEPYQVLDKFFTLCSGIKKLKLTDMDMSDSADLITTPAIKNGFAYLKQLELNQCTGNVVSFIETNHAPRLETFKYLQGSGTSVQDEGNIVSTALTIYSSINNLRIISTAAGEACIQKIVQMCTRLESLDLALYNSDMKLQRRDILAIASMSLKKLALDCEIEEDAHSILARFSSLTHLHLSETFVDMTNVLPIIGRNLVCLHLYEPTIETIERISEYCPNLQKIQIYSVAEDAVVKQWRDSLIRDLKDLTYCMIEIDGR